MRYNLLVLRISIRYIRRYLEIHEIRNIYTTFEINIKDIITILLEKRISRTFKLTRSRSLSQNRLKIVYLKSITIL